MCQCLSVGGEPEHQQDQKLRLQQSIADEEASAALNRAPEWGWGWGDGSNPWRQWP